MIAFLGMEVGWPQAIVLAVAAQRLAELSFASRNTRRLLREGGREHGAGHYPVLVGLHAAWLVTIFVATPATTPVFLPLLCLFVLLQAARVWVIATLGRYWTTRVITVAEAPLIVGGPFRWVRHPNYLVVALELAVLPLAFGQPWIALLFSALNVPVTLLRIQVEERALAPRRESAP